MKSTPEAISPSGVVSLVMMFCPSAPMSPSPVMLAVKVDELSIQGIFNCPYQEWTSWKKVALQMWETIKTERKGL